VPLDRALRQCFRESSAAVFFVTPNYVDEKYLATEIDYAIAEKQEKGERFAIITLALSQSGEKGLCRSCSARFVYKEPKSNLEGLREIIWGLPMVVGDVHLRVR